MNWSFGWPRTPPDCESWSRRPMTADSSRVDGVTDTYGVDLRAAVFDDAVDRLFRYDIFPPTLMRAHVCATDGRVAPDAVVIQRVRIGFVVMEAAVRVIDVWRRDSEDAGFTYATLDGHPERGVSRFRVVSDGSIVRFEIEAISRPGSILTSIARPFARRFQQSATRAALRHFASG